MVVAQTGDYKAAGSQEYDESPIFPIFRWSSAPLFSYIYRVLGLWIFRIILFAE